MSRYDFSGKVINCGEDTGHLLFRKIFEITDFLNAELIISNSCCYKLYVNGLPVGVNFTRDATCAKIDITDFLMSGENTLAAHIYTNNTQEGFVLDVVADGKVITSSDQTFLSAVHSAFEQQNNLVYNSNSSRVEFEYPDYDDADWSASTIIKNTINMSLTENPVIDPKPIKPVIMKSGNDLILKLQRVYNGYVYMEAKGNKNNQIIITYTDTNIQTWVLSGGYDVLDSFFPVTTNCVVIKSPSSAKIDTESIVFLSI